MEEYTHAVKDASSFWRNMSSEEQSEWNAKAQRANLDREAVAGTPLPVSCQGMSELEIKVGKKALSKVSSKRLTLNEAQFQEHPIWSAPSQMGDGPLVAITFLPPFKSSQPHLNLLLLFFKFYVTVVYVYY